MIKTIKNKIMNNLKLEIFNLKYNVYIFLPDKQKAIDFNKHLIIKIGNHK